MSMHLFVSDRALIDPSKSLVNLEEVKTRVGFLDRNMIESFVEPVEIADRRTNRLSIQYRAEDGEILNEEDFLEDTLINIYEEGAVYIYNSDSDTVVIAQYLDLDVEVFVNDPVPTEPVAVDIRNEFKLTMDYTKLSPEEQTAWESLSDTEVSRILNIAEYLTYGTLSTDGNVDVNEVLNSSTHFMGYLNQSVNLVNRRTIAKLHEVGIHRMIPRQASFKFAGGGVILEFNIWLDRNEFKALYPLTTIINVIPPLDLASLLDPSLLVDPIETAAKTREFSDGILSPEIKDRDQSGLKLFSTRYIHQGKTYTLSFGLVYRGRTPDDLETRLRLSEFLIESGYGSQALWMQRFPDIFVKNIFYLIPMYDQMVKLTNADIYPSIVDIPKVNQNFTTITETIPRIFPQHFELMTVAWDKLFIGIKADTTNETITLLEAHRTYRDFSSTETGFIEMSSFDRQWSLKLNQVIAKAAGEINSVQVATVFAGGHEWYSLIYEGNAYNVLKRTSFIQTIIPEE